MRSYIKRQAIFSQLIYFPFVSDICRQIEFDHSFDGQRLKNHVIRTAEVTILSDFVLHGTKLRQLQL